MMSEKNNQPAPSTPDDLSGLPSPPDLSLKGGKPSEDDEKQEVGVTFYPTHYPLSADALASRVRAWVLNPQEPFDKLNRIPQVDLPPDNIGYQSPFLPYKGAMLKRPM